MISYRYRVSATIPEQRNREKLTEDLKNLGVTCSETNDTVTVEGEAILEVCLSVASRFLSYKEHCFYLSRKG